MKILIFTDLHYFGGKEKLFNTKRKLVEFAEPILDAFKEIAIKENVTCAVNLGDIIQDTNDKALDLACLSLMFDRLKEFPCPVYSVLGNHDLKMMDTVDEVASLIGQNPANFSMDAEGYHLVFLSPELRPELGTARGGSYKTQYIGEDTLAWLKEDLRQNALPTFVFTHFPMAEDPRVQDECMFMKNSADVKKILLESGHVKAVFVGHQHTPRFVEEDGIPYYIIGSPTVSLLEDGIPLGVFRMIETNGDGFSVAERYAKL